MERERDRERERERERERIWNEYRNEYRIVISLLGDSGHTIIVIISTVAYHTHICIGIQSHAQRWIYIGLLCNHTLIFAPAAETR